MMKKICAFCGKEFTANFQQRYCNDKHYANCAICGKRFEITRALKYFSENPDKCICSAKCKQIAKKNRLNIVK